MAAISYCLLILFLLSGGLPVELDMTPGHGAFPAEEDFSSFDRQDETVRPSISRKRNARGRKVKQFHAALFLTRLAWPRPGRIDERQHASFPLSNPQRHQFDKVFRI
jgi:hypothetical protein